MANDFHDQEEIENFKYFWRRWGRWAFYVLLLAAAAYFGWVLYQGHLRKQDAAAAEVFETFVTQSRGNNTAAAKQALLSLQQQYDKTLPAAQATLMMAGTAFDEGRYDEAAGHLQWVLKRHNKGLVHTVSVQRLAVVYLQQQKYAEALAVLDAKVDDEFKPLLLETRGDVLQAQTKTAEAKAAYEEALKLLPEGAEQAAQRDMLQLKIDSL